MKRRDVRLKALGLAAALMLAAGALFSFWPRGAAGPTAEQQAARDHADEMRRQEIDARFRQGVVMLHAKRHDHALTAFHRVLQLDPALPEAHVNAGFALIGLGRYGEARDFFEGATALRKDQVNAYYGLAVALEGLKDLPGAVGAMRTYVHLAPKDDPYLPKARAALWEWEAAVKKEKRP